MPFLRTVFAFLIAVLVGTILVSLANTHIDLQALASVGAEIEMGVRMDAMMRDLLGFGPTLLMVLALGFIIAFPIASWASKALGPNWRCIGFTLAGGLAVIAVMTGITAFYGQVLASTITPVAASRELSGLLLLSVGGAIAGCVFAQLKRVGG